MGRCDVSYSYEALEGYNVVISGGNVTLTSRDDGINATASSGTGVRITGDQLYVYAGGDGIDSNSRSSYTGISFEGGDVLVVSTSGGNFAIDTEFGYSYTGGRVLALMPTNAMWNESTHCQNFSNVSTTANVTLTSGKILTLKAGSSVVLTHKLKTGMSATAIYLGSSSATLTVADSTGKSLDSFGNRWE